MNDTLGPGSKGIEEVALKLAAAVRLPTVAELRGRLGAEFDDLNRRQRHDLAERVGITRGFFACRSVARVRRGDTEPFVAEFLDGVRFLLRRRVSPRAFRCWRTKYRRYGARGLVDRRGRRRGGMTLDAAALVRFARLVARGLSKGAAHRLVLSWAERRARRWPRSIRTLDRIMGERVVVVELPPPVGPDPARRWYLKRHCHKN